MKRSKDSRQPRVYRKTTTVFFYSEKTATETSALQQQSKVFAWLSSNDNLWLDLGVYMLSPIGKLFVVQR